ncbi:MAG: Xaa-Pro peptidase family protein [Chloroflexota bacterium]
MSGVERLARARELLDRLELDALLVNRGALKRWLSGFVLLRGEDPSHGFAGTLLITSDEQLILADSRYTEQAAAEAPGWTLVESTRRLDEELPDLLAPRAIARCGVEATILSHATWDRIAAAAPDAELIAVDDELVDLRIVKDAAEQEMLARACALTDACFEELRPRIRPGVSELELAWQLEDVIRHAGAEALAFDSIVLFGARAAMPHGRPSDARLGTGQAVLLDFGVQVDGYRSDMTRTVFCGEPDAESRRLYELVAAAQRVGEETIHPGVAGTEVHAAVAAHIAAAGIPPFEHGLGHGIGLETHEAPSLGRVAPQGKAGQTIEVGMTFTIEPGIYLPGQIGIRIEDDYLLTDDGLRRLTASSRDLIVV